MDLDGLRAEAEQAAEDEADHAELLEARLALVDAATQVEAVASSRVIRVAAQLAEREADRLAGPSQPSSEPDFEVTDGGTTPEAIEFYLLARMATQRSLSFAGSVPLVLDDALAGVDAAGSRWLLDKLEAMSDAVQVIYLTDDPVVVGWAANAGLARAASVTVPGAMA